MDNTVRGYIIFNIDIFTHINTKMMRLKKLMMLNLPRVSHVLSKRD